MNHEPIFTPEIIVPVVSDKDKLRQAITAQVGDTPTLLGTTADGAQLSVAVHLALISALDANTTYANFKTQFFGTLTALVGNNHETGNPVDIPAMANDFLIKLQTGDIKLTAAVKGVPAVIDEIGARSTGVAEIIIAAAQQENS